MLEVRLFAVRKLTPPRPGIQSSVLSVACRGNGSLGRSELRSGHAPRLGAAAKESSQRRMGIVIRREPLSALSDYGSVSIAFSTTTVLEVAWIANGLGGVRMVEAPLCQPLTKDFDQDEPVTRWSSYGDISHWGIFGAFVDERRVGGAVVAHNTPGIHMLEGRKDLAVLWDIRVSPSVRRSGVGTRLLDQAIEYARACGCSVLKVESQNTNPAACRFYAKSGLQLGGLRSGGYAEYPDEVQLLRYLDLRSTSPRP